MSPLAIIYTLLLGALCACFVECGIYAFYPHPKRPEYHNLAADSPVEHLRDEEAWAEYQEKAERHSIGHYLLSLVGSSLLTLIALEFHRRLGVLADGILLGAVITMGSGTAFGIAGGGRAAKFAVATMSLIVCLGLGGLAFAPHLT